MRSRVSLLSTTAALAIACAPPPPSLPAPPPDARGAPDAGGLFTTKGAPGAPGAPGPLEPCASDDECALFRWDGARCCTCTAIAIRKDHERAMSARCEDGPCAQSCLQRPGLAARCVAGECRAPLSP